MSGTGECGIGLTLESTAAGPVGPVAATGSDPIQSRHLCALCTFPARSIAPSQSPNWLNTNKGVIADGAPRSDRCTTLPPRSPCTGLSELSMSIDQPLPVRCVRHRPVAPSLAFTRPNPSTLPSWVSTSVGEPARWCWCWRPVSQRPARRPTMIRIVAGACGHGQFSVVGILASPPVYTDCLRRPTNRCCTLRPAP